MRIAVCPGSFDPVTNGHLDIIERAARLFDRVIVAVLRNPGKKPLFSVEERLALLEAAVASLPRVEVEAFSGLLIEYAKTREATAIVRGLRAVSDFEFEFQLAAMNHQLEPRMETIFMMTNTDYSFISSSTIKEVASFGGNVAGLVPPIVEEALREKYGGGGKVSEG